jgi:arylsulfatase A-like enzyme
VKIASARELSSFFTRADLILTRFRNNNAPASISSSENKPSAHQAAAQGKISLCRSLITGRNHHSSGFGVVSELSTGYPGYDSVIPYMRELNAAAPEQPFLLYYAPGGTHSPHHPTKEWIEKFRGKFDKGWNAMREEIFANQKRLWVIPADTKLTPWPDELPRGTV